MEKDLAKPSLKTLLKTKSLDVLDQSTMKYYP